MHRDTLECCCRRAWSVRSRERTRLSDVSLSVCLRDTLRICRRRSAHHVCACTGVGSFADEVRYVRTQSGLLQHLSVSDDFTDAGYQSASLTTNRAIVLSRSQPDRSIQAVTCHHLNLHVSWFTAVTATSILAFSTVSSVSASGVTRRGRTAPGDTLQGGGWLPNEEKIFVGEFTKNSGQTRSNR